MQIEILTEDKSGAVTVRRLSEKICASEGKTVQINVKPHRGCGSLPKDWDSRPPRFASALLDLLPSKCRAYEKVFSGTDTILVVIMDSDENDPDRLRSELYHICRKYAPGIRSVIGLCVEEIEAWMLGDITAIESAYPEFDAAAVSEYTQDSVCGTWEQLCRVLCPENSREIIEIGYPAVGQYKAKWAEKISGYMDPDRNTSPSFSNFRMSLIQALRDPRPIAVRNPYGSYARERRER